MNRPKLKKIAKRLSEEILVVYFAARHPHTPWYAKFFCLLVVGYVLSPIDLLPDFIPFVGMLDEILILPIAYKILLKIVPQEILDEVRGKAQSSYVKLNRIKKIALITIIALWLLVILLVIWLVVYFASKI